MSNTKKYFLNSQIMAIGLILTIINNSEAESSHEKSRIHKPYFYFQEFMNEFRTSKLCAKVHTYRHILTHVHNYTSGERCHHFQIFLWRGGGARFGPPCRRMESFGIFLILFGASRYRAVCVEDLKK